MYYYTITEEHYAKGCYHYYTDDLKIYYTCIWYSRQGARKALRNRYPWLNQYAIKFRRRETA